MKADVIKGMNGGVIQGEKGVRENGESTQKTSTIQKLSDFQKVQVCRLIGEYLSNAQIIEWLKSEHNISMDSSAITHYRYHDQWQDEILRARVAFNASLDTEWGASARARLIELQKLYTVAVKDKQTPARRGECERLLFHMAAECPALNALARDESGDLIVPEWAAEGLGLVKDKVTDSP